MNSFDIFIIVAFLIILILFQTRQEHYCSECDRIQTAWVYASTDPRYSSLGGLAWN